MNSEDTFFVYENGTPVHVGDVVLAASQNAVIEEIFLPGTADARAFSCMETGGLMVHFEDGNRILWLKVDEDLEFIRRREAQ